MTADCLDESTVLAFLDGTLSPERRARAENHLTSCRACSDLTIWAAADLASVIDGSPERRDRSKRPIVAQLPPGARVGRYQILSTLGRGGMGEVYAAYHPDLDRRIALKVVFESSVATSDRRMRLLREARAIARLSHPNVVTVHDAGTVGDHVYIAMEFVDGMTIDEWRRAAPRKARDIVDVFLAAGRGLAAAHAADIVHRDFKPTNVMIGKDGSVRVMDFGLARLVGETIDPAAATAVDPAVVTAAGAANVTRTGALLGTPAYMAPEQFRGQNVDARADQFSFCVALHEALHGSRPTLAHLEEASSDAENAQAPAPTQVAASGPRWLRALLRRGLDPRPEGRFASMNALLAALARGRAQRARRLSALAATGAIALAAWGAWRASHPRRFDCQPPDERVESVWGEEGDAVRRRTIQRVLRASGRPDAEAAWAHLSSALDEHLRNWRTMYRETCEATNLRGEQSPEVLDLRMRCLADSLDETRALTEAVLVPGKDLGISAIVAATSGLSPIARCADVVALRNAVRPPSDPRLVSVVDGLGQSLRGLRIMYDLGRVEEAIAKARALRPAIDATHHAPLLGRLLETTGLMMSQHGDPGEAESTLLEALVVTELGHDDETRAKVLVHLGGVAVLRHTYDDARRWLRIAAAVLDRLGPGYMRIRSWAAQNEATLDLAVGDTEGARRLYERAVALKQAELGPNHPEVATALYSLGNALIALGRADEAVEVVNRALAILERRADPESSFVAYALNNRGEALLHLGRVDEARADFERALPLLTKHDPTGNLVSYPLTGLGLASLAAGDAAGAIDLLERALTLRDTHKEDPHLRAETRFALARALWDGGGDRRRARALALLAQEEYAGPSRAPQRAEIDTWLATRSASSKVQLASRRK